MGNIYTEAQNKATQRYISKAYDTYTLRVPKGDREKYKAFAESKGKSLNQMIVDLLQNEMQK